MGARSRCHGSGLGSGSQTRCFTWSPFPLVCLQPLGHMGQPADVGAAAVFLASEANFCTGIELLVTGGAELGFGRKAIPGTPVEPPIIPS